MQGNKCYCVAQSSEAVPRNEADCDCKQEHALHLVGAARSDATCLLCFFSQRESPASARRAVRRGGNHGRVTARQADALRCAQGSAPSNADAWLDRRGVKRVPGGVARTAARSAQPTVSTRATGWPSQAQGTPARDRAALTHSALAWPDALGRPAGRLKPLTWPERAVRAPCGAPAAAAGCGDGAVGDPHGLGPVLSPGWRARSARHRPRRGGTGNGSGTTDVLSARCERAR